MNPCTVFVPLSLQLSAQLWDSRLFHPKVYLKIAWLLDTDRGKINKIESWKCMEVGMNLSAVDRSGLGGWLLKGICSSHHTYFQRSDYIPGRLHFWVVLIFQKHRKENVYYIFHILYCCLVPACNSENFLCMEESYLPLFHFILLSGCFFGLPGNLAECCMLALALLWNLKSSKLCLELLLVQSNCRITNRHK